MLFLNIEHSFLPSFDDFWGKQKFKNKRTLGRKISVYGSITSDLCDIKKKTYYSKCKK